MTLVVFVTFVYILPVCIGFFFFNLFEMYDHDCKAVFVTQRHHGFVVMNAFGFVFFLSNFLAFFVV